MWIWEGETAFFTKQGRPKKNTLVFERKPVIVLMQTCYGFGTNQLMFFEENQVDFPVLAQWINTFDYNKQRDGHKGKAGWLF